MSDDNKDVKDEKRRHKRAAKKPAAGFKNGQKTPSTRSRNTSKKRYHISRDGTARPCSAQSEATCRLARSGTPHFDSPEQGEAYIAERRNDGVGRPVSGGGDGHISTWQDSDNPNYTIDADGNRYRRYSTRDEAVDAIRETLTVENVSSPDDYDVDAIADETIGDYDQGFSSTVSTSRFWEVVASHQR